MPLQILIELTDLCKSEHCAHEQRLLRNMGAHTVMLELLQVPYNKVGGWVWACGYGCDDVRLQKCLISKYMTT